MATDNSYPSEVLGLGFSAMCEREISREPTRGDGGVRRGEYLTYIQDWVAFQVCLEAQGIVCGLDHVISAF